MKILVAEDDAVSRLVLTTSLKKIGYEDVIQTENGREAWSVFEQGHVPILISDWMMPDINGLELSQRIRSAGRTRYTYIILLTVLGGKESYLEGMDAGADDFMTKPFDKDQLGSRLRVAERVLALQEEVRQLEGLLPICMYCKKIRDEKEQWSQIEQYIDARTDASFSHSICPECYDTEVIPELEQMRRETRE
ncbi:MAG: response regulator [Candidatus Latescibacteria bacterium]|jgi:phosphoserine phosphatase RsbU/P|nr:response regulator [Candidatus Latescibacterota bacterium]